MIDHHRDINLRNWTFGHNWATNAQLNIICLYSLLRKLAGILLKRPLCCFRVENGWGGRQIP